MKQIGVASLVIVISLALAVLCAGCAAPTTPSPSPSVASTTSATALGASITVTQGQNFTIQLQSNPSTGYRWQPTYDNSTVTLVNQAFASGISNATTAIVGAGGTDLFTFQGIKQGTSVITFNNVSPANETMNSASYTVVITS